MANDSPKPKTFLMAKQAFLNALDNAKRRSGSMKTARSKQDKTLLRFIKTVVQTLPENAEEVPSTRERIMKRRRNVEIPAPTAASPVVTLNASTALAADELSSFFPDTPSNTTISTLLSPSSASTLASETPTGARQPIPEPIEVVVETSATGEGKHTIWRYPGDEPRVQVAPTVPADAPAFVSLPGVIIKPSATGLGTHTIWLDTAIPASGPAETEATLTPSVEMHDLSETPVTPSPRRVVVRDPRSSSPSPNSSSASPRVIRSPKFRARYRSPTPYPIATRSASPPPPRSSETPESPKSKKRSRDEENDEEPEATRPRKRVSQEFLPSITRSVTRSGTPLSTQGSPRPERRGRSIKRVQLQNNLGDN